MNIHGRDLTGNWDLDQYAPQVGHRLRFYVHDEAADFGNNVMRRKSGIAEVYWQMCIDPFNPEPILESSEPYFPVTCPDAGRIYIKCRIRHQCGKVTAVEQSWDILPVQNAAADFTIVYPPIGNFTSQVIAEAYGGDVYTAGDEGDVCHGGRPRMAVMSYGRHTFTFPAGPAGQRAPPRQKVFHVLPTNLKITLHPRARGPAGIGRLRPLRHRPWERRLYLDGLSRLFLARGNGRIRWTIRRLNPGGPVIERRKLMHISLAKAITLNFRRPGEYLVKASIFFPKCEKVVTSCRVLLFPNHADVVENGGVTK